MGIIGGADGSTAVFVSGSAGGIIMAICVIAVAVAAVYFLRKRKERR